MLGELATQLTGELGTEVEGEVFLVLVEQAQLGALVGVDDGQDASDRLADFAAVGRKKQELASCLSGLVFVVFFFDIQSVRGSISGFRKRTFSGSSTKHRRQSSAHAAWPTRSSIRPAAW